MHLEAFQQRGQALELSLQMEKQRGAVEISARDQITTQFSKSSALKGKCLIPVATASLLGHASCGETSLFFARRFARTSASLVSGPLNLDLFS